MASGREARIAQETASPPSLAAAAAAAKEGGEAVSWAIRASRPDATEADYAAAEREIEEAIEANTGALAAIRNRRRAERGLLEETQP